MSLERRLKRLVAPVTGPTTKRRLIEARDAAVAGVARLRGARGGLPRAVIAGVQKGGTTFLYQELTRHPEVRGALTKELHFFDDHAHRGLDAYRGYFRGGDTFGIEASPGYIFHPLALARLADAVPDVRVLLVLRDPVARAYSHWQHEVRLGFEDAATFAEALDREDERLEGEWERLEANPMATSPALRHHSYRTRGEYLPQVQRAENLFGERLLVLRSHDLYRDTIPTVARVHAFLGLPPWRPSAVGGNDMASPGEPITDVDRDRLRAHFAPHDAALAAHLGWPQPMWAPNGE